MKNIICPLCGEETQNKSSEADRSRSITTLECRTCGKYSYTDEVFEDRLKFIEKEKSFLSAVIREMTIHNRPKPTIVNNSSLAHMQQPFYPGPFLEIVQLINLYPKTISDKLDRSLNNLAKLSEYAGHGHKLDSNIDFPIFFAENRTAYYFLLDHLKSEELVKVNSNGCFLTIRGWSKVAEIERTKEQISDQCFVAMWFDPSLTQAWEEGISKAVKESGYRPVRIDEIHHNNKICDEIIAEIRKSKFLVCDFTGNRGGVYFEAGFGMGLGLPVIWTCRKDDIGTIHFDTRQYNHILWESEEDLFNQLYNRIRATIY
ncbi:hypothetical protein [Heliorestis convoluta]|uniref:Nucleoside 2-deoxyribosyltransferase n=1 Tax=Heliorestis convoluta TaxID=356322 RepID=A0A5Q2MYY2_9FIRM|nr:hypothetical protein [Heliorestis convoluta]QGG46376.1 hypothetical protein FTV88_0197 [Heliorestis convoluta]